jgi:hypothetical protein
MSRFLTCRLDVLLFLAGLAGLFVVETAPAQPAGSAQAPPANGPEATTSSNQPVPEVPFASGDNAVHLILSNQIADSISSVRVTPTETPSWVRLQAQERTLTGLAEGAERAVRFGFSVAEDASVGEPAALRFEVLVSGRPLTRKTVRFQVAAPQTLTLKGNAPNPFRRQTTLRYTLPEPATVTIRVYDLLGRRVARLEPGRQEAGLQTVQWAPRRMGSGAYFYRLIARTEKEGRRVEQGRMTILR